MIQCPNCNLSHPEGVVRCDCGYNLEGYAEKHKAQRQSRSSDSQAYQFLSYLIIALQGGGILSILAGLIYAVTLSGREAPFLLIVAAFLGGILGSITYFAFSAALTVLSSISKKQDKIIRTLDRIETEAKKS
jgi:hypothetical protein